MGHGHMTTQSFLGKKRALTQGTGMLRLFVDAASCSFSRVITETTCIGKRHATVFALGVAVRNSVSHKHRIV